MLTTLLLSFGVPLLLGGDELGRTQGGNNNAYCQDNETSWFDWSAVDSELLAFTRSGCWRSGRAHPVFRRRRFLTGAEASELGWYTPAGTEMTQADWADPNALALGIYLDGSDDPDQGPDGRPLVDDDFLVLVNAWWEPMAFSIPVTRGGSSGSRNRQLRPGGRGRRRSRPSPRSRSVRARSRSCAVPGPSGVRTPCHRRGPARHARTLVESVLDVS